MFIIKIYFYPDIVWEHPSFVTSITIRIHIHCVFIYSSIVLYKQQLKLYLLFSVLSPYQEKIVPPYIFMKKHVYNNIIFNLITHIIF